MQAETIKLPTARKATSKASKSKAKRKAKLSTGDTIRASAFFALALLGLGVSLPHLASEVAGLTGAGVIASWLVAIIVDSGMVATKAHLSAKGPRQTIAWAILGACTGLSILLNCHAFLEHATQGYGMVAAIIFGIFLPLFNLGLSYLGSEILLRHK